MTAAAVASAKEQPFLPRGSQTYPRLQLVAGLQHAGL